MGAHGPKPLPDHMRRTHRIGVGFNELELARLERKLRHPGLAELVMHGSKDAKKGLKGVSQYLRECALGRSLRLWVPDINREAYLEFMRVAGNVNQIASAIGNALLDPKEGDTVASIRGELLELSQALIDIRFQPDQPDQPVDQTDFGDFMID
jgi:hypothetical protein